MWSLATPATTCILRLAGSLLLALPTVRHSLSHRRASDQSGLVVASFLSRVLGLVLPWYTVTALQ